MINFRDIINYRYATFSADNGAAYRVKIPRKKADIDSFFLFSLHKCGSTLLNDLFRDICFKSKIPCIDINSDTFSYGVPFKEVTRDIENIIYERGYAYTGFRSFFAFNPEFDFSKPRKILLVRDPKDAIVSLYFSVKYSHRVPEKGALASKIISNRSSLKNMDINEYAINHAGNIHEKYVRYSLLPESNLKVYRYEDVIFSKTDWVSDMCSFLGINISTSNIKNIVSRYDIVPDGENPNEHIRQVHPGNHMKYLSETTIKLLNERFQDINKKYGYV